MPIKSTKQLLNLKLIFLMGLVILGPYSFAQTENGERSTQTLIPEVHDTKNLDKLLKDYNKDQEKVLKDVEKMLPQNDASDMTDKELGNEKPSDGNDEKSIEARKGTGLFDASIFKRHSDSKTDPRKIKYSEAMKVALGPLQKMSEKELMKLLLENTKDSSAREYIDRYPKLAMFTIRLIKDKDALPNLTKIADDEDRFIRFIGIMISTILISFLLKRFMKRAGRPILKAISLWFLRWMIMTTLRFAIILYFFSDEITPTFKIVAKTFF